MRDNHLHIGRQNKKKIKGAEEQVAGLNSNYQQLPNHPEEEHNEMDFQDLQEEGIQADDEDNDQIETERNNYRGNSNTKYFSKDKRIQELELAR